MHPANALYRSRIEICRILRALTREECPIYAEIGEERLFLTKILQVDEDSGNLVIEYGADKLINSILFNHPSLQYHASYMGAHLIFNVSGPQETLLGGKPAIRFALPNSLLWYQRREQPRFPVPPHVPLQCVYKDQHGEFIKVNIVDISLEGMGGIVCDASRPPSAGTILKGCRISYPGGEPITVDLVIRHVTAISKNDGTTIMRAGVEFVQKPEEIKPLIEFFIFDFDGAG